MQSGNLHEWSKNNTTKNWLIGHFIEENSFFHSKDFEVKWITHKQGEVKHGAMAKSESKTLVILIKGSFRLDFSDDTSSFLENEGDYVSYDAHTVRHSGSALEDSTLIVIRWPSQQ